MEDELDLDGIEVGIEEKLKVKNRFEKLSEKVILTSKERDEKAQLADRLQGEVSNISKERDFYKDFSGNISKYPNASQFQDKILEKVRLGYSTEDAMVSVLAKEGQLSTSQPVQQRPASQIEGGSAPTMVEGNKSLEDMTATEKYSMLADADKTGELARALMGR